MAGNWKMNLNHLEAIALVQKLAFSPDRRSDFAAVEVAVLPPFTDIRSVQTLVDGDQLGAAATARRTSRPHDSGAYTGEVSGAMLAKLGCTYVVVGHSERRQYHAEDDALVNAKVEGRLPQRARRPIVCVGEALDVRQAGEHVAHTAWRSSTARWPGSPPSRRRTLVVAYEPVWAIGTGEVATPEDAQEVCAAIRARLGRALRGDASADRRAGPLRRLGQGRPTSPGSWPRPTSTARWSAARASTPESLPRSVSSTAHLSVP